MLTNGLTATPDDDHGRGGAIGAGGADLARRPAGGAGRLPGRERRSRRDDLRGRGRRPGVPRLRARIPARLRRDRARLRRRRRARARRPGPLQARGRRCRGGDGVPELDRESAGLPLAGPIARRAQTSLSRGRICHVTNRRAGAAARGACRCRNRSAASSSTRTARSSTSTPPGRSGATGFIRDLCGRDPGRASRARRGCSSFDLDARRFAKTSPVIAGTMEVVIDAVREVLPASSRRRALRRHDPGQHRRRAARSRSTPLVAAPRPADRRRPRRSASPPTTREAPARAHLERAGILDRFAFVAGYDSGHGAKPEAGPARRLLRR